LAAAAATNQIKERKRLKTELQDEDQGFLALVHENRPRILKICRVYAWSREDQDDLYQEILVQIWRSLPSLQEARHADTWLYRVALNTAITHLRKRAARRGAFTFSLDHQQIRRVADEQQGASQQDSAQLAALYEAIAKLDEVEKALITLFLEDLSYEQMADVLGVSASHVGVMLPRAKKKLALLTKEVSP
jgi:RNA polymerase sigma-70 factor, ECF subfamily